MAYKEVLRVEIWEVIRRWRTGHSQRRIASGRGLSRDTVVRYITAAEALGVSRLGPEPSEEHLSRLAVVGQPGPREVERPSEDVLAPWADPDPPVAHRRPAELIIGGNRPVLGDALGVRRAQVLADRVSRGAGARRNPAVSFSCLPAPNDFLYVHSGDLPVRHRDIS